MASFDEFFAEHYDEVVRTITLAVGDRTRAEDAAQEAFAKAYRRWPTVATMDRPAAWVVVVGVNQLKRWFTRQEKRYVPVEEPAAALVASPAGVEATSSGDHADGLATSWSLQAALESLPPRQRATVVLRYLYDLPTADVAKALGCSQGTVKSALHSALRSLRVELENENEEGGR